MASTEDWTASWHNSALRQLDAIVIAFVAVCSPAVAALILGRFRAPNGSLRRAWHWSTCSPGPAESRDCSGGFCSDRATKTSRRRNRWPCPSSRGQTLGRQIQFFARCAQVTAREQIHEVMQELGFDGVKRHQRRRAVGPESSKRSARRTAGEHTATKRYYDSVNWRNAGCARRPSSPPSMPFTTLSHGSGGGRSDVEQLVPDLGRIPHETTGDVLRRRDRVREPGRAPDHDTELPLLPRGLLVRNPYFKYWWRGTTGI